MTKHADRIWRTVVFAGAMLGAPLVAADTTPAKEAKPAAKSPPPKPPDTVESVTKELVELDKKIVQAIDAVIASQTDADRQAAKARLESLRKTKFELDKKLADLKRVATGAGKPLPPDTVASLTKELVELDKKIGAAVDAVAAAQTEADRQAAKARLEQHRKAKAETEKKLADLKRGNGKPPPPSTPLGKLEQELVDTTAKINTATDAMVAAQNDADRQAAKAKLASLQKAKADLENKIVAEKQRLARPRANESDKPTGRGFVLS